uniref:ubiquitinyl hydrolase 1 n=1 Tax=Meloidogyne enterolobii TaxID=390850 RepID=A0A6V7WAL9_MELEN|nr:unnamed protein product [Meloidogyne enterolobii]
MVDLFGFLLNQILKLLTSTLMDLKLEKLNVSKFTDLRMICLLLCQAPIWPKVYSDLIAEGKDKVPEGVFFMKQKIHNACGTFSLLHSLTNNLESIDMGKGSFADCHTSMAQAHKKCAESGETATPPETQVEFHFIAYLHYGGRLLEFDSAQNFPRDCGPTTPSNLLSDASKQCKNLMQNLGDIACNALAIVQKKG